MLVREVMNESFESIQPSTTAREAARKMRDGDFGALPVMDQGRVIGMLTDRDLALRVVAEDRDPDEVIAEDVMTADIVSCQEDDTVDIASRLMAERQVRRMLVMDDDRNPVGILSVGDLALNAEDKAREALSGISEPRHDEPGQETQTH